MFTFKNYCDRMLGCVETISSTRPQLGRIRRSQTADLSCCTGSQWASCCTGSTAGFMLHRINSGLHAAQDQQWASCCTGSQWASCCTGSTVGFMLHRINSGLHAAQDQQWACWHQCSAKGAMRWTCYMNEQLLLYE